jgi:hypothetical protein
MNSMRIAGSLAALSCAAISFGIALPAMAEVRYGDVVLVGEDEIIDEDLYLFGSTVRVEGIVHGDVVVAAGSVEIGGEVDGDVLSAAGETTISGPVQGSLRAVGGKMTFADAVADDLVAAGGSLVLDGQAKVGRDAIVAGGEVVIRAPIARNVEAMCGRLVLGSSVEGNVNAGVETLEVEAPAKVAGTLAYRSPTVAQIAESAKIGSIARTQVETEGALAFFYRWTRAIIGLGALGLILALLSPRFARAIPETLKRSPLRSLGWGALGLLVTPFAAVGLFFLGGLFGGWWLGLMALAALVVAAAVSFPVIAYSFGL